MTLLAVAAALAAVDWWSVHTRNQRVEFFAKPAVMVALIAALVAAPDANQRTVIIVALICSLIGDLLLLPEVDRFVAGLGAFLLAHLVYSAGFFWFELVDHLLILGALIGLAAIVAFGRPIVAGAAGHSRRLGEAVVAYVVVLAVMLTSAVGTGEPVLIAGALTFAASDAVLGWNRFVEELPAGRLATHVLYHLGQGLIVLWAL